jgi:hypothetical protein
MDYARSILQTVYVRPSLVLEKQLDTGSVDYTPMVSATRCQVVSRSPSSLLK